MNWMEYVLETDRTWSHGSDLGEAAFGIIGENGELSDLRKKEVFHNVDIPIERFIEEAGDLCYYLARTARFYDVCGMIDVRMHTERFAFHLPISECRKDRMRSDHPKYKKAMELSHIVLSTTCSSLANMATAGGYRNAVFSAEIADRIWRALRYVEIILDVPLPNVFDANIEKLKSRHPNGFSNKYHKENA